MLLVALTASPLCLNYLWWSLYVVIPFRNICLLVVGKKLCTVLYAINIVKFQLSPQHCLKIISLGTRSVSFEDIKLSAFAS